MPLTTILSELKQCVNGDKQVIVINRKNILKSTLLAIGRSGFSYTKPVKVHFSGEEAVDDGGPRREYFRSVYFELLQLIHVPYIE